MSDVNPVVDPKVVQAVPGQVQLPIEALVLSHQLRHFPFAPRLSLLVLLQFSPQLGLAVALL